MPDRQPGNSKVSWSQVARRIRVPLGFAFAIFYLWRAKPTWTSLLLGSLLALLGILIRAIASGHVTKNRQLTTAGPYAYVRNPLYLGSIVIAVGFTVAARDIWVAGGVIFLFCAVYIPVIRAEETFLRAHFADYEDYAQRVPRLLPRTLQFRQITKQFSRELFFRHREYNALLGAAAMLVALVVKMLWFRRSR